METYTQEELNEILEQHKLWLKGVGGKKADLSYSNLSNSNLSGSKGLLSQIDFIAENFEKTADGIICYKTFNEQYPINFNWKIEEGSIITENVNFTRTNYCACGINVATLDWVNKNTRNEIWQCLIKWEWLCGVCVPYDTDGLIRCEKVQLIKKVDRNDGKTETESKH